jgi:hypothetical protein
MTCLVLVELLGWRRNNGSHGQHVDQLSSLEQETRIADWDPVLKKVSVWEFRILNSAYS